MSIICYGSVNPDLVHRLDRLPAPGEDVRSRSWAWWYGGKAANAAAALAAWHADPMLLGLVVGADPLGEVLVTALEAAGVDPGWLERDPGTETRHCVVLVAEGGQRTIVGTGYQDARWQQVPAAAWHRADAVLLDGLGGSAAEAVAEGARERGIPVVWLDADPGAVAPGELVAWSRHEHTIAEAEGLAELGARVLLTAGADPVRVWWDGARLEVTPPRVDATDTTGSGDVVAAACAYGIVLGWEPERLVRWAVSAGAALCVGGREAGMPTADEVEALYGAR